MADKTARKPRKRNEQNAVEETVAEAPVAAAAEASEPPPPEIPGFDAEHLTGQLGDFLLDQVKHVRHLKPWDQLDEFEQKRLIDFCYETARQSVTRAAHVIAGRGFESATLKIDSWTVKDELKVVLTGLAREDAVMSLIRHQGALVQLVFADAREFAGVMLAKPEPNQPDMIESGEPNEPAHDPDTGEIAEPPAPGEPLPAAGML